MRFTINLVTKTYLDDRLISRIGTVIIIILLSILMLNVYFSATIAGKIGRISTKIAEIESKFAKRPVGVSEKEFTELTAKISFYNSIIRKKSYNWLNILDQMEQVVPEGIAISSLRPDLKQQIIKIEGRAKNFKLVQIFIDKLNDSKVFTSVLLLSHSYEKNSDSSKAVQFVITCKVTLP